MSRILTTQYQLVHRSPMCLHYHFKNQTTGPSQHLEKPTFINRRPLTSLTKETWCTPPGWNRFFLPQTPMLMPPWHAWLALWPEPKRLHKTKYIAVPFCWRTHRIYLTLKKGFSRIFGGHSTGQIFCHGSGGLKWPWSFWRWQRWMGAMELLNCWGCRIFWSLEGI